MTDKLEIEQNVLELLPKSVSNNLTIFKNTDNLLALRIDRSLLPSKITPLMPTVQSHNEDRTVSRICFCDGLLDCIVGYSNIIDDFIYPDNTKNKFSNVYYISGINYEYALIPNKKLVMDVEDTNEKWLVTYNKDTVKYEVKDLGKLVIDKILLSPPIDKLVQLPHVSELQMYVKIKDPFNLIINKEITLKSGTYKIFIKDIEYWKNINHKKVTYYKVPESEYNSVLKHNPYVTVEQYVDVPNFFNKPKFLNWR